MLELMSYALVYLILLLPACVISVFIGFLLSVSEKRMIKKDKLNTHFSKIKGNYDRHVFAWIFLIAAILFLIFIPKISVAYRELSSKTEEVEPNSHRHTYSITVYSDDGSELLDYEGYADIRNNTIRLYDQNGNVETYKVNSGILRYKRIDE